MARRPGTRKGLLVDVNEEDITFAVTQDQYNCAIARSIQRTRPDALRIKVNKDFIRMTIMTDRLEGSDEYGVRYTFKTPQEAIDAIVRPFDLGQPVQPFAFTLGDAVEAKPLTHQPNSDVRKIAERQRWRLNAADRKRREARVRTANPNVRTFGRFRDAEAEK